MQTKVTCPKCGKTFDYEFIPGASLNAIRLGNYRYMRCHECGKWAMFNITQNASPQQRKNLLATGTTTIVLVFLIAIANLWLGISRGALPLEIAGIVVLIIALIAIIPLINLAKKSKHKNKD